MSDMKQKGKNERKGRKSNSCHTSTKRRRVSGALNPETVTKGDEDKGLSSNEDDELPSVIISPSTSNNRKKFEKYEIVWINYKETFWPCLITAVYNTYVNYKFINESRKKAHTFRAKLNKIRKFDDPDLNAKLLEEGRHKHPELLEAYNRVVQFYCLRSTQKNLSALKFLTYDKVGDLLYGVIPEADTGDEATDEEKSVSTEVAANVQEGSTEDSESSTDVEETNISVDSSFSASFDTLNDKDYQVTLKKLNLLISFMETEDCLKLLENIYIKAVPSERMDLFLENNELKLMSRSGLGPFTHVDNEDVTDRLLDILEKHLEKLKISHSCLKVEDSSLLLRHVMMPEAIIFALQKYFNTDREGAECFFETGKQLPTEAREAEQNGDQR